jgi:hypothetical protein
LGLSVAAAAVVSLVLSGVIRSKHKAALITSLAVTLFFSYGHVYNALERVRVFDFSLGRHRFLAPLWFLLLALGTVWTLRRVKDATPATLVLNLVALALVVTTSLQLTGAWVQAQGLGHKREGLATSGTTDLTAPDQLPDIYLIILDMYARQDVLEQHFGYDNSAFIDELRGLGFYVADCSLSNYGHTELSMASELNLEYVQDLIPGIPPGETDHSLLWPYLKHSAVRTQLEAIGYQTVAFETGYPWSQLEDADFYLKPPSRSTALSRVNPFEALLTSTTAGLIVTDAQALLFQQIYRDVNYLHINRQLFVLNRLGELPSISGPKFVLAHLLVPHRPFVFAADGSIQDDPGYYSEGWGIPVDEEHDIQGYRDQVAFVDIQILRAIKAILEASDPPPIILLQSDHGAEPQRNAVLAAYYLPGGGERSLYPSISSVNTFRVLFNTYFGAKLPLLPDVSYSSHYDRLYDYWPYVDEMPGCQSSG